MTEITELLMPRRLTPLRDAAMRRVAQEAEREAERWQVLSDAADYMFHAYIKSRVSEAEILERLLPCVPSSPHGRLVKLALLGSEDLTTTLEGVARAAEVLSTAMREITPWDYNDAA